MAQFCGQLLRCKVHLYVQNFEPPCSSLWRPCSHPNPYQDMLWIQEQSPPTSGGGQNSTAIPSSQEPHRIENTSPSMPSWQTHLSDLRGPSKLTWATSEHAHSILLHPVDFQPLYLSGALDFISTCQVKRIFYADLLYYRLTSVRCLSAKQIIHLK